MAAAGILVHHTTADTLPGAAECLAISDATADLTRSPLAPQLEAVLRLQAGSGNSWTGTVRQLRLGRRRLTHSRRDELSPDGGPIWPANDDARATAVGFAVRHLAEKGLAVTIDGSTVTVHLIDDTTAQDDTAGQGAAA